MKSSNGSPLSRRTGGYRLMAVCCRALTRQRKPTQKNVKTGLEAVARYALPNRKPAIYVFTVKPLKDTPIQHGIVQPAFGQPGGGVEVLFCDGTARNTVAGPFHNSRKVIYDGQAGEEMGGLPD